MVFYLRLFDEITHFGSWFFKDIDMAEKKIKKLGKEYGVSIEVGLDGMNIKF